MRTHRLGIAGAIGLSILLAGAVNAVELAGARAVARFVDRAGVDHDRGFVRVGRSPAIASPLPNPIAEPSRLWVFSETSGVTELSLDAARWRAVRRGFRYNDPDTVSGVRSVALLTGRQGGTLVIRAHGSALGLQPVSEPSAFVEVRLHVGAMAYCARLEPPSAQVTTQRPDRLAFRGVAAPCETTTTSCSLDSTSSSVMLRTRLFSLPVVASGEMSFTCDSIDPVTMEAACTCDLSLAPMRLPGIGDVCITDGPACRAGAVDCAGNSPADVDLVADHNIGPCASHSDCDSRCDAYCGTQGPAYEKSNAACEAICLGGPDHGAPCLQDADCSSGMCGGFEGDGAGFCLGGPFPGQTCQSSADCSGSGSGGQCIVPEDGHICECACRAGALGLPAPPAALSCQASIAISVEFDASGICGDVAPAIVVQPGCMNLTTARSSAVLRNADNQPGVRIGPWTTTGVPPSCAGLAAGPVAGTMVGHFAAFSTSIGDVLFEKELVCQD